jgi:hypothetical protein
MHLVYLTHEWLPLVREIRFTVFEILIQSSRNLEYGQPHPRTKRAVVLETRDRSDRVLSIFVLWLYLADEYRLPPSLKR